MVYIKVLNLTFYYGSIKALENVTLSIDRGDMVAIVGPNGSGKTTLLKCICGILKPKVGAIFIDGRRLDNIRQRERAKLLSYSGLTIPQGFNLKVRDLLLTARYPHARSFWDSSSDIKLVRQILKTLNISHLEDRDLNSLSSGELQLVLIARALVQETPIILLDEPTAHLDLNHQVKVMEVLQRLCGMGKTIIYATHDLNIAARFSNKIIVLKKGKILALGSRDKVLRDDILSEAYNVKIRVLRNEKYGWIILPIRE